MEYNKNDCVKQISYWKMGKRTFTLVLALVSFLFLLSAAVISTDVESLLQFRLLMLFRLLLVVLLLQFNWIGDWTRLLPDIILLLGEPAVALLLLLSVVADDGTPIELPERLKWVSFENNKQHDNIYHRYVTSSESII